ncbi:MAG: hypothetical protein ACKO39_13975 [Chthoniobacterales bacterium]
MPEASFAVLPVATAGTASLAAIDTGASPRQTDAVRKLWLIFLLATAPMAPAQVTPPPAGDGPVEVLTGVYLLNLNSVNEKDEAFEADLYIQFIWRDPRLAHGGAEPLTYAEEAVEEKLKEIWWPQIEFVNTAEPIITNQILAIYPDGQVGLVLGLTATFRTDFDLRRFPFDRQKLAIKVQSFISDADKLRFVVNKDYLGAKKSNTYEGLRVKGLDASVGTVNLDGIHADFSEFRATIDVERNPSFFFWTVFGPVILIFLISCTVYLLASDQLADRVGICLTALLACIATQFALSFSLPQISYLTLIDRLFVATYGFIALNVLIASIEAMRGEPSRRLKALLAVGVPLAYMATIAALMLF